MSDALKLSEELGIEFRRCEAGMLADVFPQQLEQFAARRCAEKDAELIACKARISAVDDDLDFEPTEHESISDMANVGHSLMEYIRLMKPDYHWNNSPAEIVSDLINDLADSQTQLAAANAQIAMQAEALEAQRDLDYTLSGAVTGVQIERVAELQEGALSATAETVATWGKAHDCEVAAKALAIAKEVAIGIADDWAMYVEADSAPFTNGKFMEKEFDSRVYEQMKAVLK